MPFLGGEKGEPGLPRDNGKRGESAVRGGRLTGVRLRGVGVTARPEALLASLGGEPLLADLEHDFADPGRGADLAGGPVDLAGIEDGEVAGRQLQPAGDRRVVQKHKVGTGFLIGMG